MIPSILEASWQRTIVIVIAVAMTGCASTRTLELVDAGDLRGRAARIHLESGRWRDAQVQNMTNEDLIVTSGGKAHVDTLSLREVRAIYVRDKRGTSLDGALIGGFVGMLAGFVVGGIIASQADCTGELGCSTAGLEVLAGAAGGVVVGAAAGSQLFPRWRRAYGR